MAYKKKGISLIEIIVGVAIISVLAIVVVSVIGGLVDRSKTARTRADIQAYIKAVNLYRSSNGDYPKTQDDLLGHIKSFGHKTAYGDKYKYINDNGKNIYLEVGGLPDYVLEQLLEDEKLYSEVKDGKYYYYFKRGNKVASTDVKYIDPYMNMYILGTDGNVYTFGDNSSGQLGVGVVEDYWERLSVNNLSNSKNFNNTFDYITKVKNVSNVVKMGNDSVYGNVVLTGSGDIYVWGREYFDFTVNAEPVKLNVGGKVVDFWMSHNTLFVKLDDGTVKGSSYRAYYLGIADDYEQKEFIEIPQLRDVKDIVYTDDFYIALNNDGTITTWGLSLNGNYGFSKYAKYLNSNYVNYSYYLLYSMTKSDKISNISRIVSLDGYSNIAFIDNLGQVYLLGEFCVNDEYVDFFLKKIEGLSGVKDIKPMSQYGRFRTTGLLITTYDNRVYLYNHIFNGVYYSDDIVDITGYTGTLKKVIVRRGYRSRAYMLNTSGVLYRLDEEGNFSMISSDVSDFDGDTYTLFIVKSDGVYVNGSADSNSDGYVAYTPYSGEEMDMSKMSFISNVKNVYYMNSVLILVDTNGDIYIQGYNLHGDIYGSILDGFLDMNYLPSPKDFGIGIKDIYLYSYSGL
ncbi:MAG: prepilin-type N-terminal cleavage/methylation domain-containing protein [Candidatus Anstonellales archaeon]